MSCGTVTSQPQPRLSCLDHACRRRCSASSSARRSASCWPSYRPQTALDRSLMPWIIASQTIPILAIAPMIVVVLAASASPASMPKALISTYLSFFPVVVGMVKGLRSPEPIQLDLMRTYNASAHPDLLEAALAGGRAVPVRLDEGGVAASLVGAIVGELPTGAVAGIGARLLAGSYYGQTIQIWAALVAGSISPGCWWRWSGWPGGLSSARWEGGRSSMELNEEQAKHGHRRLPHRSHSALVWQHAAASVRGLAPARTPPPPPHIVVRRAPPRAHHPSPPCYCLPSKVSGDWFFTSVLDFK